ncbi:HPP family protein [Geomonas sp. Red69]|uniref:HPP family protein n=1 Tax=Geomonas diazotrophica TaxID=2843197 RepID=A0ABX8JK07_9BACT|nr:MULTISPECIES: HPP family protein [Geomonas]MBU5638971.1 HPP family protein [Geomonas diazotrophica]QWV98723.1 HPP family protein [Geomonas nitrogeniifigens]QXE87880.1 HPP family protein [Geomonas nitrogeniifigens]
MKRRLSVVMRRKVAIRKRLARVSRRCRAPLRGTRAPMTLYYAAWSFLSATAGLLAISEVTILLGHPLLIGSLGASAVLLFGATESPLAQPRNLVGGHLVSALVAVVVVALFGSTPLSMAFAVATSIFLMNLTHTTHPPGGATALIGVQGGAGLGFVLLPVLTGTLILLTVACFTNNVVYHRSYPRHWL